MGLFKDHEQEIGESGKDDCPSAFSVWDWAFGWGSVKGGDIFREKSSSFTRGCSFY